MKLQKKKCLLSLETPILLNNYTFTTNLKIKKVYQSKTGEELQKWK